MKNLVLHIGTSKTGSSALQSYCAGNSEALRSSDILYFASGRLAENGIAHAHLGFSMLNRYPGWANPEGKPDLSSTLAQMRAELHQSTSSNFVCSSETLSVVDDQAKLEQLRDTFVGLARIKVIVYLRRPDSWLQSWYLQTVKNHPFNTRSLAESINIEPYRFFDTLDLYARVFGAENLVVRAYENSLRDGAGLVQDFFAASDLSYTPSAESDATANRSPDLDLAAVFLLLNRSLETKPGRRKQLYQAIGKSLTHNQYLAHNRTEVEADEKTANAYLEQYRGQIEQIDSRWPEAGLFDAWELRN